ncbi:hypothetical protein JCM11251_006719 [Rhodosporidiobolus azoricus]
MSLASSFRSFLVLLVLVIPNLAIPTWAAHSHLFPPTRASLVHHHAHSVSRPSTRQLIKARQAVAPAPAAVEAAKTAWRRRLVARQLRRLEWQVMDAKEVVERGVDRIRRAARGADARRRMEGFGQEIHDNVFQLFQYIADSQNPALSRFASAFSPEELPVAELAVRPAAASASPVPSGAANRPKRSRETGSEDPFRPLSSLLSLLDHTLFAATSALPHLPSYQQEAIEAVLHDIRSEADLLAEATVKRVGVGKVDAMSGRGDQSSSSSAFLAALGSRSFASLD